MNWYIYWYFTIKYFFWGLLGYGRAGNYIGFLFFYLPFIALIMALIAPFPFVNDNKILIYLSCSVLFIFINEIVFWDETKRYRRWNNHYRNNNNNRKSWFFVVIGLQLAAVRRNRCMLFAYYSGRQYGCNAVPILNIGTLNSFIHSRRVQMPEFSPTISILSLQKTASIS